jgi:hypothetical protein
MSELASAAPAKEPAEAVVQAEARATHDGAQP